MRPEVIVFSTIAICAAIIILGSLTLRFKRRELLHRERMQALTQGVEPPVVERDMAPWTPRVYLLRGMMWLFSGIGLATFLLGIALTSQHPEDLELRIWRANNARNQGATEEQVKQLLEERRNRNTGLPPALALLGLVPIGVGVAYLIFYRAESSQPR